jgi:hypothetical protein
MSQFYQGVTVGSLPVVVPTSFVTDSGTAVPATNVININGSNGISTSGSGNNITITLKENTVTGTGTTIGATGATLISFAPINNKGFSVQGLVIGYDTVNNLSIGGEVIAVGRTFSGNVVIISPQNNSISCDAALDPGNFFVSQSGGNLTLVVAGVTGHTINWSGYLNINQSP